MPEGMKQHGGRDRPAGGGRNIRRKPPKSTAETLENQAVQPKSAVQDAAVARGKSPSYKRGPGEVPEWSIGTVSKTVVRASVPWVRIPPSPPTFAAQQRGCPPKPWRRRAVDAARSFGWQANATVFSATNSAEPR